MRKYILSVCALFCFFCDINSQINILSQKTELKKDSVIKITDEISYDSLVNIKYKTESGKHSYKWLIGQKLTYIYSEIDENNSNIQFTKLTNENNEDVDDRELVGHTFLLKNVTPNKSGFGEKWHLEDTKTNIIYFYSTSFLNNIDNRNWICQGYYDKIKSLCLNKNFVYINSLFTSFKVGYGANKLFDINTNELVTPEDKSIWKCVEIGILPRSSSIFAKFPKDKNSLILVFEDSSHKRAYQFLTDMKGNTYKERLEASEDMTELFLSCFMDERFYQDYLNGTTPAQLEDKKRKAEAEKLVKDRLAILTKKYGKNNALQMIKRKVVIGWSKTMCKESWGEPDHINTDTYSWGVKEQWCYSSGDYLYFTNGKLTAIQNR